MGFVFSISSAIYWQVCKWNSQFEYSLLLIICIVQVSITCKLSTVFPHSTSLISQAWNSRLPYHPISMNLRGFKVVVYWFSNSPSLLIKQFSWWSLNGPLNVVSYCPFYVINWSSKQRFQRLSKDNSSIYNHVDICSLLKNDVKMLALRDLVNGVGGIVFSKIILDQRQLVLVQQKIVFRSDRVPQKLVGLLSWLESTWKQWVWNEYDKYNQ